MRPPRRKPFTSPLRADSALPLQHDNAPESDASAHSSAPDPPGHLPAPSGGSDAPNVGGTGPRGQGFREDVRAAGTRTVGERRSVEHGSPPRAVADSAGTIPPKVQGRVNQAHSSQASTAVVPQMENEHFASARRHPVEDGVKNDITERLSLLDFSVSFSQYTEEACKLFRVRGFHFLLSCSLMPRPDPGSKFRIVTGYGPLRSAGSNCGRTRACGMRSSASGRRGRKRLKERTSANTVSRQLKKRPASKIRECNSLGRCVRNVGRSGMANGSRCRHRSVCLKLFL